MRHTFRFSRQLQLNSLQKRSSTLAAFETFDQSDEETWPDQSVFSESVLSECVFSESVFSESVFLESIHICVLFKSVFGEEFIGPKLFPLKALPDFLIVRALASLLVTEQQEERQ